MPEKFFGLIFEFNFLGNSRNGQNWSGGGGGGERGWKK